MLSIQRDIAYEERLWLQRAAVYVDLLAWCDATEKELVQLGVSPRALTLDASPELHARVWAFASGVVLNDHVGVIANAMFKEDDGVPPRALARQLQTDLMNLRNHVREELQDGDRT
jgi:hypothetical protein